MVTSFTVPPLRALPRFHPFLAFTAYCTRDSVLYSQKKQQTEEKARVVAAVGGTEFI